MNLSDMLGGHVMIARMSDAEFEEYWAALGKALRLACRAIRPPEPEPEPEPQRTEISNTSCSTERCPAPHVSAPATSFGPAVVSGGGVPVACDGYGAEG